MAINYGSVPFRQQSDFFRAKLNIPTARWDDLQREQHDVGFMVAGAVKADLLADLKAAIQKAIDQGTTLAQFRKDFDQIVAKHGWTGWTGSGTEAGKAWRTRVIYETNLRTSYQAGRWQQIQDGKKDRPYLLYRHSDSVVTPRELHKAWDGLVVSIDDPWVKAHYPPNGWGCKCTMFAVGARDLQRLGKTKPDTPPDNGTRTWVDNATGEVHTVPNGIDPLWDYAPGASLTSQTRQLLQRKTAILPDDIAQHFTSLLDSFAQAPAPIVLPHAERTAAWLFDKATILGNVAEVQGNPHYVGAKAGGIKDALNLVSSFIDDNLIANLVARYDHLHPVLVSVRGVEANGVNHIPLAMAVKIAKATGWPVDTKIMQANKVGHTKSSGWHRLAYQALFNGVVEKGRPYIMLDDFIGQGGTLANLKGHVESQGGNVIDALILAGKDYSATLQLSPLTLQALRQKHGSLEPWWRQRFGFGFDALTESEGRYLLRAEDANTIRARLAEAEHGGNTE